MKTLLATLLLAFSLSAQIQGEWSPTGNGNGVNVTVEDDLTVEIVIPDAGGDITYIGTAVETSPGSNFYYITATKLVGGLPVGFVDCSIRYNPDLIETIEWTCPTDQESGTGHRNY